MTTETKKAKAADVPKNEPAAKDKSTSGEAVAKTKSAEAPTSGEVESKTESGEEADARRQTTAGVKARSPLAPPIRKTGTRFSPRRTERSARRKSDNTRGSRVPSDRYGLMARGPRTSVANHGAAQSLGRFLLQAFPGVAQDLSHVRCAPKAAAKSDVGSELMLAAKKSPGNSVPGQDRTTFLLLRPVAAA